MLEVQHPALCQHQFTACRNTPHNASLCNTFVSRASPDAAVLQTCSSLLLYHILLTTLAPALPLSPCCPADLQLSPVKALVDNAASVSCGADFTAWLTKTGQVRWPQLLCVVCLQLHCFPAHVLGQVAVVCFLKHVEMRYF
jgi:hypothetical protein